MYKKLSNTATQRETAEVVNRILDGGINSIGEIRLYPGVNELLMRDLGMIQLSYLVLNLLELSYHTH